MAATPTDDLEAGVQIARAFAAYDIPYAIGGALAYGQFGIPRATNAVDVNVFVMPDRLGDVVVALRSLGIEVDEPAARHAAEHEGLIVLHFGWFRIDVFTPSIDFSWEAGRTRVLQQVDGEAVWFLSAEALRVFKLRFFRGKDVVDLERLLAVSGEHIDTAYVRQRVVELLAEDDLRIAAWDRLCRTMIPH